MRLWGEGLSVWRKMNGSGKGADCGRIRKEQRIRGGDEAERSRKGARISRVLEHERRQNKTSTKVKG